MEIYTQQNVNYAFELSSEYKWKRHPNSHHYALNHLKYEYGYPAFRLPEISVLSCGKPIYADQIINEHTRNSKIKIIPKQKMGLAVWQIARILFDTQGSPLLFIKGKPATPHQYWANLIKESNLISPYCNNNLSWDLMTTDDPVEWMGLPAWNNIYIEAHTTNNPTLTAALFYRHPYEWGMTLVTGTLIEDPNQVINVWVPTDELIDYEEKQGLFACFDSLTKEEKLELIKQWKLNDFCT